MIEAPRITVAVTFLAPHDGGRSTSAHDSPSYRPHLVVGDPTQRIAIVDARGSGIEDYLGVQFTGEGQPLPPSVEQTVEVALVHPEVDYSALRPGASFTIREGGKVVGFGHVLR